MKLELLEKLVSFDTKSSDSNLPLIYFCQTIFKQYGYEVRLWGKGGKSNLFAYKPAYGGRIVLSAHTDTVPAANGWDDALVLSKSADLLTGLGVCDMKVFIAIMLDLAKTTTKPNLAFLLTYNEETDFEGANLVTRKILGKSDYLIIGEPTENQIYLNSKGLSVYETKFSGIGGHGSEPDKGISSISSAAKFITGLENGFADLAINYVDKAFGNPKPTLNIGMIKGGEAMNVIPVETTVGFEIRSTSPEMEKTFESLVNELMTGSETKVVLKKTLSLAPFAASEKLNAKLAGFRIAPGPSCCTEANILSKLCPNTIIFGPGSISQAHREGESISLDQTTAYEQLLTKLMNVL